MDKSEITRKNAYTILKAFAKEYKKQLGKTPIEIIIVGGGSILLNYEFRPATTDFDVDYPNAANLHDVISRIAESLNLPYDWMNKDFKKTASYSPHLSQYSKHYCDFNNHTVEFRTINGEYLIAMKMLSMREYRNDMSDIIGVLLSSVEEETPLTYDQIDTALHNLYEEEKINALDADLVSRIRGLTTLSLTDLQQLYEETKEVETAVKQELIKINEDYENVLNEDNIAKITRDVKRKLGKE